MDRVQFGVMLKEARKLSGVSWIDVCYRMQKTQPTITRMLSGLQDIQMKRIMLFVQAIDSVLILTRDAEHVVCYVEQDLLKWACELIKAVSCRGLEEKFGFSHGTAERLKLGQTLTESIFLKLVDTYGYVISVNDRETVAALHSTNDCDIE